MKNLMFTLALLLGLFACNSQTDELLAEMEAKRNKQNKEKVCDDPLSLTYGQKLKKGESCQYSKLVLYPKYLLYRGHVLIYYFVTINGQAASQQPQGHIPKVNINCDPDHNFNANTVPYQFTSSDPITVRVQAADMWGYPVLDQEYQLQPDPTQECYIEELIQDEEWDKIHDEKYPEYLTPW